MLTEENVQMVVSVPCFEGKLICIDIWLHGGRQRPIHFLKCRDLREFLQILKRHFLTNEHHPKYILKV